MKDTAMLKRADKKMKMRHSERGVAVVEFSILAVIFLIIVFGLLEFSVMFFQKHYIAGAAREGVRTGVIATNYECFKDECDQTVARYDSVCDKVRGYLGAVFDNDNIACTSVQEEDIESNTINIIRDPSLAILEEGVVSESVELSVTVTVDNFMPEMITGLVPEEFSYTAIGAYEDPSER